MVTSQTYTIKLTIDEATVSVTLDTFNVDTDIFSKTLVDKILNAMAHRISAKISRYDFIQNVVDIIEDVEALLS